MKSADKMQQTAVDLISRVLTRRLAALRVSTSRPDFYIQCEPGPVTAYPGGFQVHVKNWRRWSTAQVSFDGDSGELLGYAIARYAEPQTEQTISREEALEAVRVAGIEVPEGAVLETFRQVNYTKKCRVAQLQWRHVHQQLPVHGDFLVVSVHPETRRVIEYFRRWRQVRIG